LRNGNVLKADVMAGIMVALVGSIELIDGERFYVLVKISPSGQNDKLISRNDEPIS
jgi:hypothetical protein